MPVNPLASDLSKSVRRRLSMFAAFAALVAVACPSATEGAEQFRASPPNGVCCKRTEAGLPHEFRFFNGPVVQRLRLNRVAGIFGGNRPESGQLGNLHARVCTGFRLGEYDRNVHNLCQRSDFCVFCQLPNRYGRQSLCNTTCQHTFLLRKRTRWREFYRHSAAYRCGASE
jgi:hypothetical protein